MANTEVTSIVEGLKSLSVIKHRTQQHAVEAALSSEIDNHTLDDPSLAIIFMKEMIKTSQILDGKNEKLEAENKRIKDIICSVMDVYSQVLHDRETRKKMRRFSNGVLSRKMRSFDRTSTRRKSHGDKQLEPDL
jgi:hypothetical protein